MHLALRPGIPGRVRRTYIACPPGPKGAHKFTNESSGDCVLLAVGEHIDHDVCEYPDSDKVGLRAGRFRKGDAVDYWDGE